MTDVNGSARARGNRSKPATPERLERVALWYLDRYASSAENLRRVLLRRVERSAREHDTDREAGAAAVDRLVARFRAAGLLDDLAYGRGRALSQHRKGASLRAIRAGLAAKGLDEEAIEASLLALREETGDPELAAAIAYARRRRLGPFRPPAERAGRRARDLAALGRRGFGYGLAQRVIDAPDPAALAALLTQQ